MPSATRKKGGSTSTADLDQQQDTLTPEPWLGRLRFVLVPAIAIVAIVAVIYLLQDRPSAVNPSDNAAVAAGATGAFQQVQVPSVGNTPAPRIGNAAPVFTLTDLDGKSVSLADFRGKAVFLNFFATWCPPCRAEMPDILATYEENKMNGAVVVAVDLQEDAQTVRNYANAVGLTFPVVLDRNAQVSAVYRIAGIPTSYFIDKDGVIRDMQIGAMSKSMMLTRLKKAMQE